MPQQPYAVLPGHDPGPGADAPPRNGAGTAALILGILAVGLAFVPVLGLAAVPPALLGIVFGLLGLRRVGRRTATHRGVAATGLVASVLGLVLVVITVIDVEAIDAGMRTLDRSITAVHHITYAATSSDGSEIVVSYTPGGNGAGTRLRAASPWSVDATVTGSAAVLTVSSSSDVADPARRIGLTCSIVDADTGQTVVTTTVPPSGPGTVSCDANNLGG